ncbi:MAG: hypothetical protein U0325_27445 [Polyangiales bacterium]
MSSHWTTYWRFGAVPKVAAHTPPRWMRSSQNAKMVFGIVEFGSEVLLCSALAVVNDSMPLVLTPTDENPVPK